MQEARQTCFMLFGVDGNIGMHLLKDDFRGRMAKGRG